MLIGYARVSTEDQHLDLQRDAIARAGCGRVFEDRGSGAKADRPGLLAVLDYAWPGDCVVVWRLDRFGRSLPDLIALVRRMAVLRQMIEGAYPADPGWTAQWLRDGERHRAGERIWTGFVESAVNQVVSKRFSKKQSMRWTQAGAHLALQARTRVLNGELEDAFRRRWPGFQPMSKAEPNEAKNGSFVVPPPPAVTAPVAHGL